jgi:hypothetical protein
LAWIVLAMTGFVLVRFAVGGVVLERHDAMPLHAAFAVDIEAWIVLPVGVALACMVWGARLARSLPWRRLLAVAWGASVLWTTSLAGLRGYGRITAPLEHAEEYLAVMPRVASMRGFLATFVDQIGTYPVHVQGHPPGLPLLLAALDRVGPGGSLPVALLYITVAGAAVPLVLLVAREVVDEEWARRAAPFLVVAPMSIWVATSADAFFTGVGAAAVALVVLATGRVGRRGDRTAVTGGLLFGCCAYLSYGLVLLALVPIAVAVRRRTARPIVLAGVGALPVVAAFSLAGFWWVDGLLATKAQYFVGVASRRPYEVYLVANLASFAIMLGPAAFAALTRLRDTRAWILAGSALCAVAIADVSGMSKAEVERIWLPFAPFVLLACGALWGDRVTNGARGRRFGTGAAWLSTQAACALAIEGLVRTAW